MEGDDHYPWKLREHGEAASALSSSNIKERAIQNLAKSDAISLAIPNGENDVIPQEMIMPNNPNGGSDVVPAAQLEEMRMANPNGANDVLSEEMMMANNPIGENDDKPDATEPGSLSTLSPSCVTRSFASYTSTDEPASSSEILLSEITLNFSEGHSVGSITKTKCTEEAQQVKWATYLWRMLEIVADSQKMKWTLATYKPCPSTPLEVTVFFMRVRNERQVAMFPEIVRDIRQHGHLISMYEESIGVANTQHFVQTQIIPLINENRRALYVLRSELESQMRFASVGGHILDDIGRVINRLQTLREMNEDPDNLVLRYDPFGEELLQEELQRHIQRMEQHVQTHGWVLMRNRSGLRHLTRRIPDLLRDLVVVVDSDDPNLIREAMRAFRCMVTVRVCEDCLTRDV